MKSHSSSLGVWKTKSTNSAALRARSNYAKNHVRIKSQKRQEREERKRQEEQEREERKRQEEQVRKRLEEQERDERKRQEEQVRKRLEEQERDERKRREEQEREEMKRREEQEREERKIREEQEREERKRLEEQEREERKLQEERGEEQEREERKLLEEQERREENKREEMKLREEQEREERKLEEQQEEERICGTILISIRTIMINAKLDSLENKLKDITLNKSYRKFIKTKWACHLGYTSNTGVGGYCFETPHQITIPPFQSMGIDLRHPSEKSKKTNPPEQLEIWDDVTDLMKMCIDAEYVSHQYVVHCALTSSSAPYSCPNHEDDHDIAPQYIFHLGEYTGAELRMYAKAGATKNEKNYFHVSEPRQIIYFDSRLTHGVHFNNFRGYRYTVIVYQLWREDKFTPDPIFFPPRRVF
jgi:hypothetical protein